MRFIPCLLVAAANLAGHAASAQTPWSVALYGGYATGVDNSDFTHGSLAVISDVYRQIGRTTALGVELGYQEYERRSETVVDFGTLEYRRSAWHIAGVSRIRSPVGRVRPYALAGIGLYVLRETGGDFVAPGLNAGGGLEFHPTQGPFGIGLGARFHLAGRPTDEGLGGAGILTLMLGLTYR